MQIQDMLAQMGGFQSIAKELGVSESQAQAGGAALLPAILGGLKKQAQSGGSGALGGLLNQLGGGGLLDDVLGAQPTNINRGNDVLGQIFGSKDVSRAVAQDASAKTGLDAGLLKKMLPMMAMLATGLMARHSGSTGTGVAAKAAIPGLGGLLGKSGGGLTGGGLIGLLDSDGDGNPLDDIMRLVGKKTG